MQKPYTFTASRALSNAIKFHQPLIDEIQNKIDELSTLGKDFYDLPINTPVTVIRYFEDQGFVPFTMSLVDYKWYRISWLMKQ